MDEQRKGVVNPDDPYSGFDPGPEETPVTLVPIEPEQEQATPGLATMAETHKTDPRVLALYQEGLALQETVNDMTIATDEDARGATSTLSVITGVLKRIEEARTGYTKPINEHLRAVNADFKEYVAPIENASTALKAKMLGHRQKQKQIQDAQIEINRLRDQAAQKEAALNEGVITEPVNRVEVQPNAPKAYRGAVAQATTPKLWKFRVEDFEKLPDEFKVANEVEIRKVVVALKKEHPIPGVIAWAEETISVRPT